MTRHREDPVVVEPALDDDVHLDRVEPGGEGCVDSLEHARDREVDVVHRAEDIVVERVEAHGDASQPGVLQALGLGGQEGAVGGKREVEPVDPREHPNEGLDVAANQWLASRDADLLDAEAGEGAGDALDLLEGEELGAGEERVVAAEDLLGHAIDAAEVAAVGDRDPEIPHRPSQRVGQPLHV